MILIKVEIMCEKVDQNEAGRRYKKRFGCNNGLHLGGQNKGNNCIVQTA